MSKKIFCVCKKAYAANQMFLVNADANTSADISFFRKNFVEPKRSVGTK